MSPLAASKVARAIVDRASPGELTLVDVDAATEADLAWHEIVAELVVHLDRQRRRLVIADLGAVESDYCLDGHSWNAVVPVVNAWDPYFPPWYDDFDDWLPPETGRLRTASLPIVAAAVGDYEQVAGASAVLLDGVGATEPFSSLLRELDQALSVGAEDALRQLVWEWRADAFRSFAQ